MVAVDTNILLDIVLPEQKLAERSYTLVAYFMKRGPLIICDVVYGELATVFHHQELLGRFLQAANIKVVPNSTAVLWAAGSAWRAYSQARSAECGNPVGIRQHIIPDFLIGAHALGNADRLLTRDRGVFQRYFPQLITQARL